MASPFGPTPSGGSQLPETTLPELFEAQAARTPQAVAVTCGDATLSYAELDERANRLARYLASLGAGPERLVAVAMERSADLVVMLLAVLKSGAGYLPVDPEYPAERISYMLGDARPVLLACDQATAGRMPVGGVPRIVVDDQACAVEVATSPATRPQDQDQDRAVPLRPAHPAYVIYTSGSTGRPKGVVVQHRNVARLVAMTSGWVDAGPGDAWTLFHSYAFDFSVWEMWGALATGGRLVIVPYLVSRSAAEFRELLAAEQITVLSQTPAAFYQLMDTWGDGTGLAVRYVIFGGEALDCARTARWARAVPDAPVLVNMYGITETTVHVTAHVVDTAARDTPSVIGAPLGDLRVFVLDESLQLVPPGVAGEMYVAGAGVARGYLGRPGLTGERFVACPFHDVCGTGRRMYRTGDLARWNSDGELEYLGRSDDQVKIRGFRIELGEIEAVLAAQPGVAAAVATVREDRSGDQRLAGYVVPATGVVLDPAGLRDACGQVLPGYMVPSAVVVMEALPLTPSGKLDRRALPAPDYAASAGGRAPASARERTLCEVFAQVLDLDQVGVEDSFFDLGGHSLLATRLVSRVRAVLGVELAIRAVFEHPTPAALARVLDSAGTARTPLVPAGARPDRLPLSFAQQRLWFLEQLHGPGTAYNLPFAWRLRGQLDTSALTAALNDVVARHESLRTVFTAADGQPCQCIIPAEEATVPVTITTARSGELTGLVDAAARHEFDLATELPVRAWLFTLAEQEHVLVLLCHHITSDGWSMQILMAELAAAYAARRAGRAPGWADLPVQYADYALWQRELLGSDQDPASIMSGQVRYWRQALAGLPEELALPADRPRPAEPSQAGGEVRWQLADAGLHKALDGLARERHASVFMVMLAGLAALLSRMGAGADIPVGAPVAGRTDEAIHDLVGFFVNTLVLRADVSGDPGFGELLDRVKDVVLAAQARQDVPFERLVEVLNPVRSPSRHPLFQVVLADQDVAAAGWELPGLAVRDEPVPAVAAKFDLTLGFQQDRDGEGAPAGISAVFEYAQDLFDEATVGALGARLTRLLRQAAASPDRPLSTLDLLTASERQALEEWNRTAREIPEATLPELFEAQAKRTPYAAAVTCGSITLSYAELDERGNRLARHLIGLGAGPEQLVAIAMPRSADMIVAVLAVLKTGAAYVPVDPSYPPDRIGYMLTDTDPVAVLTTAGAGRSLPGGASQVVLDDPATMAAVGRLDGGGLAGRERRPAGLRLSSAAYVIYTSGSTGWPKGVVVEHRSLTDLVSWVSVQFSAAELSKTLASSSLSFDFSVFEILAPLAWGGCVEVVRNVLALADEFDDPSSGRMISGVPSAISHAVTTSPIGVRARTVVLGGEVFTPRALSVIRATWPGARVVNIYGPTETTVYATSWSSSEEADQVPTIGRPTGNTRVLVLDDNLGLVPPGVGGELYVAGAGLARGYLGRPGLTAERFVACPFGTSGERMYRTGDLARWTVRGEGEAGGDLEYLGRSDDQVKVRGFRIELGEVQAVLAGLPGVAQAAVVVREDREGDQRLAGYVVPAPGTELDPAGLREACGRVLPRYMVPTALMVLDRLPLSPIGKLDRRALPAPEYAAGSGRAPATAGEQVLCEVFAQVLGLDRVGVEDSFFDLGGHSLLATRLVSRIRVALGAELAVRAVFEYPTVASLAGVVEAAEAARPVLVPVPRPERLPLSFAQQRLWFLEQFHGPGTAYNQPFAWRLTGRLDTSALTAALDDVVARHESLRTIFTSDGGQPYQHIIPAGRATVPVTVTAAAPGELTGLIDAAARHEFDLAAELPVRASLFTLAEQEHVLLLLCHHIASDGWSMQILMSNLATAYQARSRGRAPQWPPLPVQYADYALWQRELLGGDSDTSDGGGLPGQVRYWEQALAGLPEEVALPADRPRPAEPSQAGGEVRWQLADAGLHRVLDGLAREHHASVFMVMLAGLAALLARMGAGTDIPVGAPVAGRTDEAVHDLVGFFVNTLVLRADVSGDPGFGELLDRVKDVVLAAQARQDVPFERLVEVLNPVRSLARHPLFQVVLADQDVAAAGWELPGLAVRDEPVPAVDAKFDLTLGFQQNRDGEGAPTGISGVFEYARDLFDHATVEALAARLTQLFRQAAASPDRPLSALDLLAAGERQSLEEWNRTARVVPGLTLAELFEAQAVRTPGAVAVACGDVALSYAVLGELAGRLAGYLVSLGAGPERLVAVVMEKSAEVFVAWLGVVMSGAAFLPVDVGYPAERVGFMLADAGPDLVVTTSAAAGLLPPAGGGGPVRVVLDDPVVAGVLAGRGPGGVGVPRRAGLGNPAYVIYTSGSTGRPKGTVVTHRGLASLAGSMAAVFGIGPGSRVLQLSSLGFDAAVMEVLMAWPAGAALVVPGPGLLAGEALAEALTGLRVSHALIVPSVLASVPAGRVDGFGCLVVGGEACPDGLAARWSAGRRMFNAYGPTEVTIVATLAGPLSGRVVPPIGRPVWNTRVLVLDEMLRLVPPGVGGELYVAGAGLARGYLGRPGLTGERFTACPFGGPGERMYRTGDVARWNAAGELEFLGRSDDQVKVRGFRIELGEVESVLAALPGVAQAAVAVREDRPGDRRLAAYVVPAAGTALDRAGLREACGRVLPGYMVPAAVVVLDALPLTASGKLDRRALPAPEYAAPAGGPGSGHCGRAGVVRGVRAGAGPGPGRGGGRLL